MVVVAERGKLKVIEHITVYDLLRKEAKLRIRMTRDLDAAFDGITVQKLKAGESYDIPASFAERYLSKGIAIEDKAIDAAPEIKEEKPKILRRKPKR